MYLYSGFDESPRISRGVLLSVLAVHAVALVALMACRKMPMPVIEQPILVSLVSPEPTVVPDIPPAPVPVKKPEPVPEKPKPVRPVTKPVPIHEPEPLTPVPLAAQASSVYPQPAVEVPAPQAAESSHESPSVKSTAVSEAPPAPVEPSVVQPRFNADYLNNPAPVYPPLSRRLREEGRVLLRVLVNTEGNPTQVNMHQSSGFDRLDERALETVRRWKFVPASKSGEPVDAWVIVPIQFSLKG